MIHIKIKHKKQEEMQPYKKPKQEEEIYEEDN